MAAALGGVHLFSNPYDNWTLPADTPIKGITQKVRWNDVELSPGNYSWSQLDASLLGGARHGAVSIGFNTQSDTPEWLYKMGVRRVTVLSHHGENGSFPYYLSPLYQQRLSSVVRALCQHLSTLPLAAQPFYIFAALSPTGDTMPWSGTPVDRADVISQRQFETFLVNASRAYVRACPTTPIMINPGNPPFNATLEDPFLAALRACCPTMWYKGDRVGHGAGFNYETQSYARLHGALGNGTVRSRAEGPESDQGWWREAPLWALRHLLAWALQFGLDYWTVHEAFAADATNWAQFEWFNRWAGRVKDAGTTPGAFIILHDGLDAADVGRFPEDTFGNADVRNQQRYLAIAKSFAARGAQEEDVKKAATASQKQEKARALNDVGWETWRDDYAAWLERVHDSAEDASIGWWRVGAPDASAMGYGRFGRGWAPNASRLRFRLSAALWRAAGPPAVKHVSPPAVNESPITTVNMPPTATVNVSLPAVLPAVNVSLPAVNVSLPAVNVSLPAVNVSLPAVNVSVAYYDRLESPGGWTLEYVRAGSGTAAAMSVPLLGDGEWKEASVVLSDLQPAGELALRRVDGTADDAVIFHSVEVLRATTTTTAATTTATAT